MRHLQYSLTDRSLGGRPPQRETLPRIPTPPLGARRPRGGQNADVVYAGAVPFGWAGLLMVQAKVPAGIASGDALGVTVSAGGVSSQSGATMAVR